MRFKKNVFLVLLKITFFATAFFILPKMKFLVATENEILLFSVFGSLGKIFSLKMKTEIQLNTFPSPFSVSSENENRKQPNQTPPYIAALGHITYTKQYNQKRRRKGISAIILIGFLCSNHDYLMHM